MTPPTERASAEPVVEPLRSHPVGNGLGRCATPRAPIGAQDDAPVPLRESVEETAEEARQSAGRNRVHQRGHERPSPQGLPPRHVAGVDAPDEMRKPCPGEVGHRSHELKAERLEREATPCDPARQGLQEVTVGAANVEPRSASMERLNERAVTSFPAGVGVSAPRAPRSCPRPEVGFFEQSSRALVPGPLIHPSQTMDHRGSNSRIDG